MKFLRLRKNLSYVGLVLLKHGDGWKVTDHGVKQPIDLDFRTLEEVEQWIKDQRHANRLTDEDDAEWDAQFRAFCEKWRDVQCLDCLMIHPRERWKRKDDCCPSCGERNFIDD